MKGSASAGLTRRFRSRSLRDVLVYDRSPFKGEIAKIQGLYFVLHSKEEAQQQQQSILRTKTR